MSNHCGVNISKTTCARDFEFGIGCFVLGMPSGSKNNFPREWVWRVPVDSSTDQFGDKTIRRQGRTILWTIGTIQQHDRSIRWQLYQFGDRWQRRNTVVSSPPVCRYLRQCLCVLRWCVNNDDRRGRLGHLINYTLNISTVIGQSSWNWVGASVQHTLPWV